MIQDFKELRIREENLMVGGNPVFTRKGAQVHLARTGQGEQEKEARFLIDWHRAALPIVQEWSEKDPLFIFKRWLARMLILRPMPSLITGDSEQETLEPNSQVTDFGAWFSALTLQYPSAYTRIDEYLKQVMPDLKDLENRGSSKDFRSLEVRFSNELGRFKIPFADLSDGEKCFMICALVLAANHAYGPVLCFWDEPDNYLALDEVGHFVMALRSAFHSGGQLIATSHNPEAIRRFSKENIFVLHRRSHLEPTILRPLSQLQINGDLINALIRGDLEL
ncbi:MAG: AAA family ATPase [Acidobacteriota bacterium]